MTAFDYEQKRWGSAKILPQPSYLSGLRLKYALDDIAEVKGSILDAGCGAGAMTAALKSSRQDLDFTGIDLSIGAINEAKQRNDQINFVNGKLEELPFGEQTFDAVVCFDVLEHLQDCTGPVHEISRVLKLGGILHICLPLEGQGGTIHEFLISRGWEGKKRHSGHLQAFSKDTFNDLAIQEDLEIINFRFSSQPISALIDVAYYVAQDLFGKSPSSIEDMLENQKGFKASLLRGLKTVAAYIGWYEAKWLSFIPGSCGHFCFRKIA